MKLLELYQKGQLWINQTLWLSLSTADSIPFCQTCGQPLQYQDSLKCTVVDFNKKYVKFLPPVKEKCPCCNTGLPIITVYYAGEMPQEKHDIMNNPACGTGIQKPVKI